MSRQPITRLIFLISIFLIQSSVYSQCDYLLKRYAVRKTGNLIYGTDLRFNLQLDTLRLDLYKPIGDNNLKRPILVWIHGGGFTGGDKAAAEDAQICQNFAARGYVVASINYRMGFVPPLILNTPYAFDKAEVIRAVYRATQDARAAIRWMKARGAADSSDPLSLAVGGGSAGAITALHVAYADQPSEKPKECDSISSIFNTYTFKRPDMGPVQGTQNLNGYDASVRAVLNIFGGIMDTMLLQPGDAPLYSYHQTNDPVVSCGFNPPYHGIGLGIPDNYPPLYGVCSFQGRLSLIYPPWKYRTYIYSGNQHAIHNSTLVDTMSARFLNNILCNPALGLTPKKVNSIDVRFNPVEEKIILGNEMAGASLQIISSTGTLIREVRAESDGTAQVRGLAPQVYFVLVRNGQQTFSSRIAVTQ